MGSPFKAPYNVVKGATLKLLIASSDPADHGLDMDSRNEGLVNGQLHCRLTMLRLFT